MTKLDNKSNPTDMSKRWECIIGESETGEYSFACVEQPNPTKPGTYGSLKECQAACCQKKLEILNRMVQELKSAEEDLDIRYKELHEKISVLYNTITRK